MASLVSLPCRWRLLLYHHHQQLSPSHSRRLGGHEGCLCKIRKAFSLAIAMESSPSSLQEVLTTPDKKDGGSRRPGGWQKKKGASLPVKKEPPAVVKLENPGVFAGPAEGFEGLGLSPLVLKRLEALGLQKATAVQSTAIPSLVEGHDAAIQSSTGSGKTLAYLLPLLSKIGPLSNASEECLRHGRDGVKAVVVAPSRELAMQIVREAERLLGPDGRAAVQQLIGGANQKRQEEALKKNKPAIVVGTPGRLSEISKSGKLNTHGCRILVLDESDQLLSQRFRIDMMRILQHVGRRRASAPSGILRFEDTAIASAASFPIRPDAEDEAYIGGSSSSSKESNKQERQTVLVSATMPPAVLEAAARWGHSPLHIRVTPSGSSATQKPPPGNLSMDGSSGPADERDDDSTPLDRYVGVRESMPPNLAHWYVVTEQRHRVDTLRKVINALAASSALVFMNFGRRVRDTEFKLKARGINAGSLHGDLTKVERMNILAAFREGKLRVLVASDVAARGLDVVGCDLVVNLELPTDGIHYAHRAGRTGRIGRAGTVVSICEASEEFVVGKFDRQLDIQIRRAELAEGRLQEAQREQQSGDARVGARGGKERERFSRS